MIKSLGLDKFVELLSNSDTLPVEKAYNEVAWFNRAVDIRADKVGSFPFDLIQGNQVVYTEDLVQSQTDGTVSVQEYPADINVFHLLPQIARDLDLYGAFYAIYETNRHNRNGKWRRLYPKSIKPLFDKMAGLIGFERNINGHTTRYDVDELLYVWVPPTSAEVGHGKGTAESVLMSTTALRNTEVFQSAFFENGALNPTIISIADYKKYNKDEQSRVQRLFKSLMAGVKKAFNIIPLSGDVTVNNLQQPLEQMGLTDLTKTLRETINTGFGVPQSLTLSNAANFATATQDVLNFYDYTLMGFVRLIEDQLNARLMQPKGYILKFRKARLEVFQQVEAQKADRLNGMLDRDVITIAEYREMMDLPPMSGDDSADDTEMREDTAISRLQSDDDAMQDELRKWRKFAAKRYKEGNPEKALDFESHTLPVDLVDSVTRTLSSVMDVGNVYQVFDDAELWLVHA